MKSHHVDLLNEAIAPALTRLALPIMATSLVQMLYNLTDMAWIGRLGAGAVTAVGSAGMYTWFSQGFAILARTGGQVKTAHCLGAGENDSAAQYARGALQLGILFAVLYGLVSLFGASRLIGFFKLNSPEVIAQAEWYVRIACGLVIFSYLNAILTGLLTAAGNSRTPFIVNVAGLVFNVVLDPVLIFGIGPFPELGVSGAAAATVTAQALVSLLFFRAVLREKVLFPHLRLWVLVPVKIWREIVRIGVPSAVQNLIYAGISMILTRLITGWGDLAVAAQRVGSQIESVSWMVDALLTISEFCIVRIRACPAYAFQFIYHCHVLLGYLKIKKLQILLNPHRGNGFGQRKMSFLQAPPQTDLGCGPAVFLSKLLQLWIFQKLSGTKGTPRLHQDVMLFAEGRRFRLHPAGMELNLVYHRNDLCCFQQRLHMHREKIAYTDGPYIPFFQQIFKGLPGLPVYLLVGIPESQGTGPMDQVQIQIIQGQPF